MNKAVSHISSANLGFLFLAFLTFFISRCLGAYRINTFYKTQDLYLSNVLNLKLHFLSMFYNLFIPLVGGEGYKAIWLKKRYPLNYKQLVGAAFLDRLSGMLFLSILSVVFILFSSLVLPFEKTLVLLLIPILLAGHILFIKLLFKSFRKAWRSSSVLSLFIQLLQVMTSFFIIKSLGIDKDVNDYLFIFLLSSFAFVLPMLGAREMAFVFGAEVLGLNLEISLAISLLFYLVTSLSSLLGGYYLLFPNQLETKLKAV